MKAEEQNREALERATTGQSTGNYGSIFEGFMAKGVPLEEIRPRENVLTFRAWLARGRVVRKGERGVRILSVIDLAPKKDDAGEGPRRRKARQTTVFHISQTQPLDGVEEPNRCAE